MEAGLYRPYAILDETRSCLLGIVPSNDETPGLSGRVGAKLDLVVLDGEVPGGDTLLAEEIRGWMAEQIYHLHRDLPHFGLALRAVTNPRLDEEMPGRRKIRPSALHSAAEAARAMVEPVA